MCRHTYGIVYVSNVIWNWCIKCCAKIDIGETTTKQNALIAEPRLMNTSYINECGICDLQGPKDNVIDSMGSMSMFSN